MTEAELKELGLTADQYEAYFGDDNVSVNDTVAPETEPVVEATEQVVEQPVEETASVEDQPKMVFKNVKAAAEFLVGTYCIKLTCAVDSIYRALRGGTHITHKYRVSKSESGEVVLQHA